LISYCRICIAATLPRRVVIADDTYDHEIAMSKPRYERRRGIVFADSMLELEQSRSSRRRRVPPRSMLPVRVYKLNSVVQFPGTYGQAQYGFALESKSAGDPWLKNHAGVIMHLKAKREGLMLSLGGQAGKSL
jgi:hypothetical protein